jgi:BlaI family transcriptional regulator, penicillinase repressor
MTTHENKTTLGELQLAIMRVLWDKREATATDVHQALDERGLAPTTIATMLVKMERKGVVRHTVSGRKFIYQPVVTEPQVRRSMVGELQRRLFAGDTLAFVSHLLSEHDIDARELTEIKKLLATRKKEKA